MNVELVKYLGKYKEITLELIASLEKEQYDLLENLLQKRHQVIDDIGTVAHTQEEFREVANKFQLLILQKKLTGLMNVKRNQLKDKMSSLKNSKIANKSYNNKFNNAYSLYFNRKI